MIKKNLAAEPYVWEWVWNATYSNSDSASLVSVGGCDITLTWGAAYIASTMGIRISISTTSTNPAIGSAASYSVTFDSPWWSATLATGSTFLGSETIRLEADDVTNNGSCASATLSFSALRIYVNGGLVHTISAQTISSSYDPRLNICTQAPNATLLPAAIATTPTCPPTKPTASSVYHTSKCSIKGGWKRSGVADAIIFDLGLAPTPPGCGCDAPLSTITYIDSHDVYVDSDNEFGFVISDLGVVACYCSGGGGNPGSVEQFKIESKIIQNNATVSFTQKDEGIVFIRDQTSSSCNGGATISTDHTYDTTPDTYSLIFNEGAYDVRTTYCNYKLPGPSFCPAGSDLICPLPAGSVCYSSGLVSQSWPVKPPCSSTVLRNLHRQYQWGQMGLAYIDSGNVKYKGTMFTVPALGWDYASTLTSTGDVYSLSFDQDPYSCRIWMYIVRYDGTTFTLYRTYSDSWGSDFLASLETIMAGPALPSFRASQSGDWFLVWAEYISGTSGDMYIKGMYHDVGQGDATTGYPIFSSPFTLVDSTNTALVCADGQFGNIDQAYDYQGRWTMTFTVSGETVPSVWYSFDQGRSWSRI